MEQYNQEEAWLEHNRVARNETFSFYKTFPTYVGTTLAFFLTLTSVIEKNEKFNILFWIGVITLLISLIGSVWRFYMSTIELQKIEKVQKMNPETLEKYNRKNKMLYTYFLGYGLVLSFTFGVIVLTIFVTL